MQDEYSQSGRIDRGVKEQSLAVLAKAGMPAVRTEIGFVSNPEEEEYDHDEICFLDENNEENNLPGENNEDNNLYWTDH